MPDNALKRLGNMRKPGAWIVAALEGVQESNGPGRTDPGWLHPSDMGHPCDAYWAFKLLGAPSTEHISARLRRIFDNGSGRDEYLKKDFKKAGISLIKKEEDRKIVIPELRIRGELDDWVVNPATGERFVVDIKTMNNDEFEKLETLKPSHHAQIHPYMFAKQTYQGIILYENKNNQEFKPMPGDFQPNFWQREIVDRVHRVLSGIRNGHVSRTPVPNESLCPFFNICSHANFEVMRERSGITF